MDQQQTDIKELLQLYNNAMQIKKRAEKKLIRFTNCLSELDRRNCGSEIVEQINVVRQKIKEERKIQVEQTVRNSYVQLQKQMDQSSLILKQKLSEKELQLESMELEYKCQLQQQQNVINDLNLQVEEVKDYNQDQIFSLTQKNQQLLNLIEDLNKQIAELKQILEHYQNEEFKSQLNNNSSIRVSQNSQMLQNIQKLGSQDNYQTTESIDQCQFETLPSEVKYQETCENFDEEILLGSSNQCAESKELQSPIRIQDQSCNPNQINELTFAIEELREQIHNLQQEKQRLIDNLNDNQDNFNTFKEQTQLNETNLNNQIKDLIASNQDLIAKEQILQTQISEQKNEIVKIEKLTEDLETSQQLIKQKDDIISRLTEEQQQKQKQIQSFEEQLEFIPKLKEEIQNNQKVILEKDEEINNLKKIVEQEQNLNIEKQKTNQILNEKSIETQNSLDQQIQQNQNLQNENQSLIQDQLQLKEQIILLKQEIEQQKLEQRNQIQELESKINSSQAIREELDQKLNQQQALNESLNRNEQKLIIQNQELTQQLCDLETKYKVKEQENEAKQQEIEEHSLQKSLFQTEIEELQQKYQRVELELYQQRTDKEKVEKTLNELNKEFQETIIQNQQLKEEIVQLNKSIEELNRLNSSKDLQRDEQIKFQKQLENQYKILEEQLKDFKLQSQQECTNIADSYKEELRMMQEQLLRSSENIKQYSPVREISLDDKYKEQINRLNDELRLNKLQIAQFSTVNNQLKQQQKDLVLKLQSMLKLTPGGDQDLNDLILIVESNLSSCQSSPVRQTSKRTSMIDTTKMLMNKSRASIGSNRGSVLVSQNHIQDNGQRNSLNIQDNGFRSSLNVQKVPSSSQSNTDLQKILDDVSDQDIIQQ